MVILLGVEIALLHFNVVLPYDTSKSIDALGESLRESGELMEKGKNAALGMLIFMAVVWAIVGMFMLRKKKWEVIKDNFEIEE